MPNEFGSLESKMVLIQISFWGGGRVLKQTSYFDCQAMFFFFFGAFCGASDASALGALVQGRTGFLSRAWDSVRHVKHLKHGKRRTEPRPRIYFERRETSLAMEQNGLRRRNGAAEERVLQAMCGLCFRWCQCVVTLLQRLDLSRDALVWPWIFTR